MLVASALLAAVPAGTAQADKRWEFYTKDKTPLRLPLVRRRAPDHDPVRLHAGAVLLARPTVQEDRGFHHGLDIAMPCGTKLRSDRYAKVVRNDSLGPAYGDNPLLLRNYKHKLRHRDRAHPEGLREAGRQGHTAA